MMDWKAALVGFVAGFASEWVRRVAVDQYRFYLGRKAAKAEQTETTTDDDAVAKALENLDADEEE